MWPFVCTQLLHTWLEHWGLFKEVICLTKDHLDLQTHLPLRILWRYPALKEVELYSKTWCVVRPAFNMQRRGDTAEDNLLKCRFVTEKLQYLMGIKPHIHIYIYYIHTHLSVWALVCNCQTTEKCNLFSVVICRSRNHFQDFPPLKIKFHCSFQ